jgi:uncharacterized protein YbjT (DUF2867 family)
MEAMRVLLTGATGYVGRRLMERLAADTNVELRLFVRNAAKVQPPPGRPVEIVEGTSFDPESLRKACAGMDAAFYLIHSLGAGAGFGDLERRSAENFRDACADAGVGRIIYLGGLGTMETASEHLRSRLETGEILSSRPDRVRTLWFRAGVVIGSGSASFEIIRNLVQKLPVMITPKWVLTKTAPIGIGDVVEYLRAGLTLPLEGNLVVDIGAGTMTFRDMLLGAARAMGLRRRILRVPFFSPRLSSYWLLLMTPVPYKIARALVDGLKSETIPANDAAARLFPGIAPAAFEDAVRRALEEIERHQVVSRWCDSTAGAACELKAPETIADAVYRDRKERSFAGLSPESVFRTLLSIGGDRGWFAFNGLWRIRGWIDKLAGGPGLNRGRRDAAELRIGDGVDFWKVLDLQPGRRLLLLAQMKLPGRAWLEFVIEGDRLVQTAYFLPRGLGGRLYWYAMLPAHVFIFRRLIRRLLAQAKKN